MLLRVLGDDVDGPLTAGIAWVGGNVEAHTLPNLKHLEAAISHRGVVEKELAAP